MTDMNQAPSITSGGGGISARVLVTENTDAVATVTAADPDVDTVVTYSIVGGPDANRLEIDSLTGALTFVSAPHFASPDDSDRNNVYDIVVMASDGTLSDTQSLAVQVLNVGETTSTTTTLYYNQGSEVRYSDFHASGLTRLVLNGANDLIAPLSGVKADGSYLKININAGAPPAFFHGAFYFMGLSSQYGYELYRLRHGATDTLELVRDIRPGSMSSAPLCVPFNVDTAPYPPGAYAPAVPAPVPVVYNGADGFTVFNDELYFTANDGTHGVELWKVQASGNAVMVGDFRPGSGQGVGYWREIVNGEMYFPVCDGTSASIWKVRSDGAAVHVADAPGLVDASLASLGDVASLNDALYYWTRSSAGGYSLWRLTADAGVTQVAVLPFYSTSSATYKGALYFNASDADHGSELWRIDASGQLSLVADINPGANSSSPYRFVEFNNELFFTASSAATGSELWKVRTDGSVVLAADLKAGSGGSDPSGFTLFDGAAYFSADFGSQGRELAEIDAAGNVYLARDIYPGINLSSSPASLAVIDGSLYFTADDGTHGRELWVLHPNGSLSLHDLLPGAGSINPRDYIAFSGSVIGAPVVIAGTDQAETITGTSAKDTITGKGGNDILDGREGDDSLDGGGGLDAADYAWTSSGVEVNLSLAGGRAAGVESAADTLISIENVVGGSGDDSLTGNGGANVLRGLGGDDTIDGGMGSDVLDGGDNGAAGDTVSYAHGAAVKVNLALASRQSTGGGGSDTMTGFENLTGSAFNDVLTGDQNANTILGLAGNDTIAGGFGADRLDGGEGALDIVSYAASLAGVTVSLLSQDGVASQAGGDAADDILTGFEGILGSRQNDTLTGDVGANKIDGGLGDDFIEGGAGDDVLIGGSSAAAPGNDTASYAGAASRVVVSLALTAVQDTLGAGKDKLTGFESLTGSGFDDVLTGSRTANSLSGGAGSDTLSGGLGNDILTGGSGIDYFVFDKALNATTNVDSITDFSASQDFIRLENAVFSALKTTGTLDAGAFIVGAMSTTAEHRIIYDASNGHLLYDRDGNGSALAVQFATLSPGLTGLGAGRFEVV